MPNAWTCCCTEHGEPLAVFTHGQGSSFELAEEREAIAQAIADALGSSIEVAHEWLQDAEISQFYLRDTFHCGVHDACEDYPWRHCQSGTWGAVAVTGIRFDH